MTPEQFRSEILAPGLAKLATIGGRESLANSAAAEQMLLTIAMQESALTHRAQVIASGAPGPARGWWQFERGGGVAGVMQHPASSGLARRLCEACHVPFEAAHIWRCLEGHDALAVGFARLLLWTDARPLPTTSAAGWQYYLDNWRPGRPRVEKWAGYWASSARALAG